ncbi:MAG: hypothetical protein DYG94_11245 [Leptolyngbya sp. PLA3]|nr:MAG: hypothetical protein EDM82_10155 [Cyanobacteria bacterium CYA]MCE7969304.1 hypothetical protein [Leptolyngbya sp. PL-A3]
MIHHNYHKVLEARACESTWACIRYLGKAMVADGLFPVADERFHHPGEETICEAMEIHPGADRALVRAYFNFRPEGA